MKKIVVIGGSRGIGNAIVKALIEKNHVVNISRNEPENSHKNLTHYTCNILTDELPTIDEIDTLIYCPGSINLKPISRIKLEEFREDFEINVIGAVKAIQHFLPSLKKGKNPSILLFSTVAAKLGMPFHASIAAAKSGVEGLTKSLGAELAPTIRINAIAPTITDTDLASKLLRNEKMIESITERHPLKKFLHPKEVADLASFLISDNALSISGQIFELDCGIVSFKI
ncbi:MAG: SDR family oxidoreductase [Flavobacteriia bacterium]|nr:SDR family oxidoreductase [Flavobacteriia bacterium]OIP46206.1 MAG: oxidoreductase [Flavobacteriaceae bacterium CG2_30_31_66]PIV96847.1 MAG: oxidoreductase [Flavobacteriaceae bacterium CG17_big_fil_post_rev_8_21_14_2_50_31_13]PIX14680.1 MAG: oxidoreductase [Flavobacteriaceae bacterium CG_4_8_14_3_um_filter_31_8]PIY15691.1 MAG: oxidoreductase [Flavobacteriaceae bacterium CG_4_10_14_3_um_filter_31_253]PIZ09532.1 MAG: oxidoreductase [Flavobacteriaceae bacterium CG_4_10_14_0_8_um_filter_31_99]